MINKLLLNEIEIKSKLIKVLNELIIEQSDQLDSYRKMIHDIDNILNNNYIDV